MKTSGGYPPPLVAKTLILSCLFTLGISLEPHTGNVLHLDAFSASVYLAFATSLLVHRASIKLPDSTISRSQAITVASLAGLFAAAMLAGALLDGAHTLRITQIVLPSSGSAEIQEGNRLVIAALLTGSYIGFFAFYHAAIRVLFIWSVRRCATSTRAPGRHLANATRTFFSYPICCSILILGWLPAILSVFPGSFASDASHQLAEFSGAQGFSPSSRFPVFSGLLYRNLYLLGTSIDPTGHLGSALILALQVACTSIVASAICIWLHRLHAPRWLPYASLAFFALFPLVAVRQIMLGYDTLHAALFALFVLQIALFAMREKTGDLQDSILFRPWAIACIGLLLALTRNNGIFIFAPTIVLVALLYRSRQMTLTGMAALAAYLAWQGFVIPSMGIAPGPIGEALSIPAQISAAQLSDGSPLSEDDRQVYEQSFSVPLEDVAKRYDPIIADPIKSVFTMRNSHDALRFSLAALHASMRSPVTSLSGMLCTTYGAWYPFCQGTYWFEYAPYLLSSTDEWGAIYTWYGSPDELDDRGARFEGVQKTYYLLNRLAPLSLLYSPGGYAWLVALVLAFALWSRSSRKLVACSMAPAFMLELVMFAGPCASIRYAFPIMLCLPIMVFLFIRTATMSGAVEVLPASDEA